MPAPVAACREKRFRHSRHMRNPQFYVSGKKPIASPVTKIVIHAFPYIVMNVSNTQIH